MDPINEAYQKTITSIITESSNDRYIGDILQVAHGLGEYEDYDEFTKDDISDIIGDLNIALKAAKKLKPDA